MICIGLAGCYPLLPLRPSPMKVDTAVHSNETLSSENSEEEGDTGDTGETDR